MVFTCQNPHSSHIKPVREGARQWPIAKETLGDLGELQPHGCQAIPISLDPGQQMDSCRPAVGVRKASNQEP